MRRYIMKIYDYENQKDYVKGQAIKIAQIRDPWVKEDVIKQLSDYLKKELKEIKFGICHGARLGDEVYYFNEYLPDSTEVIGTELFNYTKNSKAPTKLKEDFAKYAQGNVICDWDFHEIKDEWIDNVDFIYTNSFDHSWKPELALDQWMKCLKKDGICIIEKTMTGGDNPDAVDCFRASEKDMLEMFNRKYQVVDQLVLKTKYKTRRRQTMLNLDHPHWIIKHKESDK
jgi:hypothetical protein